jgi:competence protein ComGC
MKKIIFCFLVSILFLMAIPTGVGQQNNTFEEKKESAQTLFYPVAKISWNMSSTEFELV